LPLRKSFLAPLLLCAFALSFFHAPNSVAQSQLIPPKPERVIVMSLDGARPDALVLAETPNIQALARRGAVTWQGTTTYPSVTMIAHASMLTGLDIAGHGVDDNDNSHPCPPIESPTFLTLAQGAGYQTAMVVGKEKFCRFNQSDAMDYTFARAGDGSVVDRVIELLDADYQVIFVHLPNPDYFGHLTNWMSDTYIYELSNTDYQVGRILTALEDRALTDTTLVILTADHGGTGNSHGQNIPEHINIPWMIAGPGVSPGINLTEAVSVMDTAPTVLWALDIAIPENTVGHPVEEAFGIPAVAAVNN
jgi:arylsulfatase A-like enzyme